MPFLRCEDAPGEYTYSAPMAGENTGEKHPWEAFVWKVPGVGEYNLVSFAQGSTVSTWEWYGERAELWWRLVNTDVNGKPDCSSEIISETSYDDGNSSPYNWGQVPYGSKYTFSPSPTLQCGTKYALVVRGTGGTYKARSRVTHEVPTGSEFKSWWATAVTTSNPPIESDWREWIGNTFYKYETIYAEIAYVLKETNKRQFGIPDERIYPLETRNYPILP
ncbi:MAG: hypothetical protein WDA47_08045 [Bacilli bacterium]